MDDNLAESLGRHAADYLSRSVPVFQCARSSAENGSDRYERQRSGILIRAL